MPDTRPPLQHIGVGDMAEPTVSAPRPSLNEGGVVDDAWGAKTDRREAPPPPAEPMFSDKDLAELDEEPAPKQGRLAMVLGVALVAGLALGLVLVTGAAGVFWLLS